MKNIYLLALFFASFWQVNAQTYCAPAFTSGCGAGDQIDSFTIGTAGFSDLNTGCSPNAYGDFTSTKTITLSASVVYGFNVTHDYSSQNVRIWADFNNDFIFDDVTELIGSGASGSTYETNGSLQVPSTVTPGTYRLRIADKYNIAPVPCETSGFGEIHDYTLIVTTAPSCVTPSGLTNSAITSNTATLSWTAPPTAPASGYEVYYSTTNVAPASTTAATISNITTTTTNLSGLLPATTYYAYVRSKCSSTETSAWSLSTSFLTNCVTVAEFTENFDGVAVPNLPVCWEKTGTTGDVYTDDYYFSSAPNALYLGGDTFTGIALVKLPSVSTLQLGTYRLKFKLSGVYSTGGKMEVGYLTNPSDPTTFTALDSFTANSSTVFENVVVNNISVPTGVQNLYFRQTELPGDPVLIDDVIYELTPSCAEPTALVSSNITATTVDVAWNAPTTTPANGYELYYTTVNTIPTSSTVPSVTGITNTATTVPGLTPATKYYIYVRSNCSTTEKSSWSSASTIITSCVTVTEFSENFDAVTTPAFPPCWAKVGTGGSASTETGTFASAPNVMYIYSYSPTDVAVVKMPETSTLSLGTYQLKFKLRANFTVGGSVDVGYLTNPTDETTFVSLGNTYVANSATASDNYTINNIAVPSGVTTLAFKHTGAPSYSVLIDDVVYQIASGCLEPSALTATNPTLSTVDLAWTAPTPAPTDGYEIYYSTSSANPTNATPATVTGITATSTTLTGLSSSSTYYVWVRANCSATSKSDWTISTTFNTACNTANTPYTQDFSGASVPGLPNCTTAVNDGNGNLWKTSSSAAGFTGKVLNYSYNSNNPANTWFFTQGINMVAGTTYYIGYKYGNNGTFYEEKMKVAIGTANNSAAMTTTIANYPNIQTSTPISIVDQTFIPATSGVYYLGFQAYSDPDQNQLFLDDITVTTTALSTNEIAAKENVLTVYPNPFTDVVRISDIKDVVSISIVDLSGRLVKTMKPAREINLGDLKTGMYLINLKMKNGSVQTVKAIKK